MDLNTETQTILFVDDDRAIRTLVKAYLEKAGYCVLIASDGAQGLSVFRQHQTSISLLLTDITMPHMNGVDLADHVLELDSQVPVLFISGNIQQVDRGYGCIAKPFTPGELVGRVGQVLARREQRPASHTVADGVEQPG